MNKPLAALLCCLPLLAAADERILSFHSDIRVMSDAWIEVTETIQVRAEGERILRGIYRDIPTEYFDKLGNRYAVDIDPTFVLRNDESEAFHTTPVQRGIRIYFGHADRYVAHGVHTYAFRYRASRMLGFFEAHDELYWNVTGFDWMFPIDKASATVELAFDTLPTDVTFEAFTGPFGARREDYIARQRSSGVVEFEATKPLSAVNGLTIVVAWPKGFVAEPSSLDRLVWLLKDNKSLLIALTGLALLLAYCIPVWRRHGKDPDAGVIVTLYEPPQGFSPASLRYIRQMYYDDKVMTAAIVNLAVKGYLKIEKSGETHKLTKLETAGATETMAAGERELLEHLFGKAGRYIELDSDNYKTISRAKRAHSQSLLTDYKHKYFQTNVYLNFPAIVIVLGATFVALGSGGARVPLVLATIVVLFLTLALFAMIMKRPTLRGRKLLDEMLGFKDYLEVAEKDELNLRNPPEKTPELFERYLPFALALGVDQEWTERFASVLAAIQEPDGGGYRPGWYAGSWNSRSYASSINKISGGLSSSISRSLSPPGSTSGSSGGFSGGGGGSSGGGGGGGGGGGW